MQDTRRPSRQRLAFRRMIAGTQELAPGLDLQGQDAADRPVALDRVDVAPEHALDVPCAGASVHLRGAPLLGVRLEGVTLPARGSTYWLGTPLRSSLPMTSSRSSSLLPNRPSRTRAVRSR